ncbi:hypothetical protein PM082_016344 [Marasmius tenuissimus]|nr:hypothetical protein PM082_016344 [Marasmius tenuissimus]
MEEALESPELVLGRGESYHDDLSRRRWLQSDHGHISLALRNYGAHLRPNDGSIANVIHISMAFVQLFVAARHQLQVNPGPDSHSSWLTVQAMLKIIIVHEMAHFLVRSVLGVLQGTPQPDKDHSWIVCEMLEEEESEADSGFMVEVLWLGHRSSLVIDTLGRLRLFVPSDLGEPAFTEEEQPAEPPAFTVSGFSIKLGTAELAGGDFDQDDGDKWEPVPDPNDLNFESGWLVEDHRVAQLLGPRLPLSNTSIFSDPGQNSLSTVHVRNRQLEGLFPQPRPKPSQSPSPPAIALPPSRTKKPEGIFTIPLEKDRVIMLKKHRRRKDVLNVDVLNAGLDQAHI